MKIAFLSPYLGSLHRGGGEKHLLDTARFAAKWHQVELHFPLERKAELGDLSEIKSMYESYFGISLEHVRFVYSNLIATNSPFLKFILSRKYDALYLVTDGSFFFSSAKKNIVHFQIPFGSPSKSILNSLKIMNWPYRNTNSKFTRKHIVSEWKIEVQQVHYPLINLKEFKSDKIKKNRILHVGRFFKQLHAKRQDVLIDIFELLQKKSIEAGKWELHLAGHVEDAEYFSLLQNKAKGLPIFFHIDIDRSSLLSLYASAKIYWHATGYQINETINPDRVEHFGISTIEAIASGCVPIVHGKGGQTEILYETAPELLWQSAEDCVVMTKKIIESETMRKRLLNKIEKIPINYGESSFEKRIKKMF